MPHRIGIRFAFQKVWICFILHERFWLHSYIWSSVICRHDCSAVPPLKSGDSMEIFALLINDCLFQPVKRAPKGQARSCFNGPTDSWPSSWKWKSLLNWLATNNGRNLKVTSVKGWRASCYGNGDLHYKVVVWGSFIGSVRQQANGPTNSWIFAPESDNNRQC